MYDRLLALYLSGRLGDNELDNAANRGWITEQQADDIRAAKEAAN